MTGIWFRMGNMDSRQFYCFCLSSIYSNNDGNGFIEGAVEAGGTI